MKRKQSESHLAIQHSMRPVKKVAGVFSEDSYNITAFRKLLGHKDVSTTMIYTQVLNRGGYGLNSPADRL